MKHPRITIGTIVILTNGKDLPKQADEPVNSIIELAHEHVNMLTYNGASLGRFFLTS